MTAWLRPIADRAGAFRISGVALTLDASKAPRDVELAPFYAVQRRTYAAYWDLLTRTEYDARLAQLAAEHAAQRRLEAASVAFVPAGDADAEKPFTPQGEDTSIVRADGRAGRRGAKWFSYVVPVDASTPLSLVVTYNSDNRRARTFDILIDGTTIAAVEIPKSSVSQFVDARYDVAPAVLRGRRGSRSDSRRPVETRSRPCSACGS